MFHPTEDDNLFDPYVFGGVFQSDFQRIEQKWLEVMAMRMHDDTEARSALAKQDFLRLDATNLAFRQLTGVSLIWSFDLDHLADHMASMSIISINKVPRTN